MIDIPKDRTVLHRWLFSDKSGKTFRFSQRHMPFAVFKTNAVWGGTCEIGDAKCRIRIRHNNDGEKGKRLEVWFPHEELGKVIPYEKSTLVGYMKIKGNWREGTGECYFEPYKKEKISE